LVLFQGHFAIASQSPKCYGTNQILFSNTHKQNKVIYTGIQKMIPDDKKSVRVDLEEIEVEKE
jgi:hypothetical protein